jgi:hypothetical protein
MHTAGPGVQVLYCITWLYTCHCFMTINVTFQDVCAPFEIYFQAPDLLQFSSIYQMCGQEHRILPRVTTGFIYGTSTFSL